MFGRVGADNIPKISQPLVKGLPISGILTHSGHEEPCRILLASFIGEEPRMRVWLEVSRLDPSVELHVATEIEFFDHKLAVSPRLMSWCEVFGPSPLVEEFL